VSDSTALARSLTSGVKVRLRPGAVHGHWGAKAKLALRRFDDGTKVTSPIELPTVDTLLAVQDQKKDRVCVLSCNPNEIQKDSRCVALGKPERTRTSEHPARGVIREAETKKPGLCWGLMRVGSVLRSCTGNGGERPAN
jgi:hypothetical protein